MSILRLLGGAVAALLLAAAPSLAQDTNNTTAFQAFVAAGDYEKANFYLANGYVTAANIDSGQIFYTTLVEHYGGDLAANLGKIDRLYNYLAAISPIDLNRRFACGSDSAGICLLANTLSYGARPAEIAWFVTRGLDLNKREADIVPATLPLLTRLGTVYSMTDLNWFVANGMVLGDETYSIEELVGYEDRVLSTRDRYRQLTMPDNFLNLGDQNLLDVLIIALATDVSVNARQQALRRDVLCNFITYAASAYTPSFDYLRHVLKSVPDFRGDNIGKQTQGNGGVYAVFPTSCVLLVKAMATSHAHLDQITSEFANQGDVPTASWLLSIQQGRS
ncbi:MAG: hypothetical protein ABS76_21810 [Pelagibacterium sp. SCN 64-44]|nr:MAG: hypothetical protein ABS76_21810 [Pelagibacterium sp. SCN 64-44]